MFGKSYQRAIRTGVALLLWAVVCPGWRAVADAPFPPPEEVLKSRGLATDDASLLGCLEKESLQEIAAAGPTGYAGESSQGLFRLVREVLTRRKVSAAVPILAAQLNAPFPAKDQQDRSAQSGAQKDEVALRNVYSFRCGCAESLGRIGDRAAVEPLLSFARTQSVLLKDAAGKSFYPYLSGAFGAACTSLGMLGRKEGVELLIQALPSVPLNDSWATTDLIIITGQPFGPEPCHPAHVAAAAREEWIAWWQDNRDRYAVDSGAVARRILRPFPPADPMALRDYIRVAEYRTIPPLWPGGPEAAAWLEEHGPKIVAELAALVNNPDEAYNIRGDAMEWYVRFGGKKALKTLARYARNEVPFDPADAYQREFLHNKALELIRENSPKLAERLARETQKKH